MSELNDFSLVFKRHKRAKRLKLRYDATHDQAIITMPPRSSEREATKFANKHISWLNKQRSMAPTRIYLLPGYTIPFKGINRLIIHTPDNNGRIKINDNEIIVGGTLEGFSVRLENYLKKMARADIEPIANTMANRTAKTFKRIQIRDTKSRWGSCSSSGNLSFSWRLIMTPPEILEYVVAHEIAHLTEMNHSRAFWQVVDTIIDHATVSRKWIKNQGQHLMLILKNPT
ncbi:MAG: M48 family metallopeptidase [Emcibacteraceae bacterium]|nr:M48 family metallopeptidase [Emcibacteraceae bacterium]